MIYLVQNDDPDSVVDVMNMMSYDYLKMGSIKQIKREISHLQAMPGEELMLSDPVYSGLSVLIIDGFSPCVCTSHLHAQMWRARLRRPIFVVGSLQSLKTNVTS